MVLRPRGLPPERGASVWRKNTALMPGCIGLFAKSAITERLGFRKPEALGPSSKVSKKRIGASVFSFCSVCCVSATGGPMQPLRLRARAKMADTVAKGFMVDGGLERRWLRVPVIHDTRAQYNKLTAIFRQADECPPPRRSDGFKRGCSSGFYIVGPASFLPGRRHIHRRC